MPPIDGLGMFWRGCTSRSEKEVELLLLCVIDIIANTAFALKAFQTLDQAGKSLIDLYAEQITSVARQLRAIGRLSMEHFLGRTTSTVISKTPYFSVWQAILYLHHHRVR